MENAISRRDPFVLSKGEGKATWFADGLMTVKASGEDTENRWTVLEYLLPAGQLTPAHIHHAEDEAWYILQGEVNFHCGDRAFKATAGSFVFGPKDVVHGFEVGKSGPARMLVFASPSGFEKFVEEFGAPAKERTLPAPGPLDIPRLLSLAEKYRFEVMPPPGDH
jgi:quercetin dioxygenase-like cupin family protein